METETEGGGGVERKRGGDRQRETGERPED